MEKSIIYMGNFLYPDGNAAGKRVSGNIKIIQKLGYKPIIFCFRKNKDNSFLKSQEINGVAVYTIPYSNGIRRLNFFKVFKEFKKLFFLIKEKNVISYTIMYSNMATFDLNKLVIKLCKKNDVKVIYDFCDYFDKIQKNNIFKYCVKKRDLWLLNNCVLKKCDGYICISNYLSKMINKDKPYVIIPPLSIELKRPVFNENEYITISYATVISDKNRDISEWKDRIDIIIDLFYNLYKKNIVNWKLNFIGFTRDELLLMFPKKLSHSYNEKIDVINKNIKFWGFVNNNVAQSIISKSDFTILIRDSKICTNAGFPTKVSESITNCVPVLVNATSDILKYITDSVDGFILADPSNFDDILFKLEEILVNVSKDSINNMKEKLKDNNSFYFDNYLSAFYNFIKKIEGDLNDI